MIKSEFKALDNISFSIKNDMYGLLDNSGAGKTTWMNDNITTSYQRNVYVTPATANHQTQLTQ